MLFPLPKTPRPRRIVVTGASVITAFLAHPLSSIEDIEIKPVNEAQLRELISVPVEKRPEAWKSAVKLAGDKPLTAKIVHKAALKFKSKKTKKAGKVKKKPGAGKQINPAPA